MTDSTDDVDWFDDGDFSYEYPVHGKWHAAAGETISIKEMSDTHLLNTTKLLLRRASHEDSATGKVLEMLLEMIQRKT